MTSMKAANVEESYTQQLKQQKTQWELAEKQRRDKWVTEKTKLIKDQTVRSLEPEIQRMLAVIPSCVDVQKNCVLIAENRNTKRISSALKPIFRMKF